MSHITLTRLLVTSDRSARCHLAGIVVDVMVGITLLLVLLATTQTFPERSMRSSWAPTALIPDIPGQLNHTDLRPDHTLTAGELTVASNFDVVGNQAITVLKVALSEPGTTLVRTPDSDIVPKLGEYLASPTLAKCIVPLPAN